MARNFPIYTNLQSFYEENYDKEDGARLSYYMSRKRGQADGVQLDRAQLALAKGLPKINPMQYALRIKREEEAQLRQISADARSKFNPQEMQPPTRETKAKLYDGFTREGKGRYAYLKDRHMIIPEEKFTFPTLNSMRYGWKLDENFTLKKPRYARNGLIKSSFYTRNGVPDLPQATEPRVMERAYTSI